MAAKIARLTGSAHWQRTLAAKKGLRCIGSHNGLAPVQSAASSHYLPAPVRCPELPSTLPILPCRRSWLVSAAGWCSQRECLNVPTLGVEREGAAKDGAQSEHVEARNGSG